MHCDISLDVVRNPAWSSLVMKRLAAKAMPLMSKTNVLGHARQVTATRCQCFSCARPLALIMASLTRSEQRASWSLRKSANVSRNWAIIANGVSCQKSRLEPKRQESTSDPTRSCANVKNNTRALDLECADGSSGQDEKRKKKRASKHRLMFKKYRQVAPRAVWIFDMRNLAPVLRNMFRQYNVQTTNTHTHTLGTLISGNIAPATRSTLRQEGPPCKNFGHLAALPGC